MHAGNDAQDFRLECCPGMVRCSLLLKGFSVLLGGRPDERSRNGFPSGLPSPNDLSHELKHVYLRARLFHDMYRTIPT